MKIPSKKNKWSDLELAQWAQRHPVGTRVRYWPVRGYEEFRDSTVRSEPWRLGHGMPIVKIEGTAGGVAIDHLRALPDEPSVQEIREKVALNALALERLRRIVSSGATKIDPIVYETRAPRGTKALVQWGCIALANVDGALHVWPLPLGIAVLAPASSDNDARLGE
jgi:hypothetical protein